MANKVILFSRVSTSKQTLVEQTEQIRQKALSMGYSDDEQILIQYKESAIKLSSDERAGIVDLKNVLKTQPDVDCLILWELSRISRRGDIIYEVRDLLVANHIRWIVLKPYMEILGIGGAVTPMTNLLLGIFVGFVENEMLLKRDRFKRGKESCRERGLYGGGPVIYGYTIIDKHYVVDEQSAAIVRYVFDEVAVNGRSGYSVAKEFYDNGKLGMMSLGQYVSKVKHILSKEEYCGNKYYPQIVPREQWVKAQKNMKSRYAGTKHATLHTYYCQGLVFDGNTGHALTPEWNSCIYTNDYKPVSSININLLDSFIFAIAHRHYLRYGSATKNETMKKLKQEMVLINKKRNLANRRKTELADKIEKIEIRFINGKITEQKADELEADIEKEIKHQTQLIDQCDSELRERIAIINKYKENIANVTYSEMLPDNDKREIIHTAIKRIEIKKLEKCQSEIAVTFDDLHTEVFVSNNRSRVVTDSNGAEVEYVYERRITRQKKVRRPNKKSR